MPTRVLVIDDDASTCDLIEQVLAAADIECLALTRSDRAAQHLSTEKFHAIFLDVNMPPPDGIELTRKIRSGGLNASTPIMVITGDDDRGLLKRAFATGANYLLYKPIDRQDVLQLLRATQGSIESEKRRFRRVKVRCRVSVSCGRTEATGSTLDLSLGGMFVQVSQALPIGSIARVTIHPNAGQTICVSGRVLRVAGDGRMGMQFENSETAEIKRLQDFLLSVLGGESAPRKAPHPRSDGRNGECRLRGNA